MNLIEEFGSYEKAKKHQIERALNGLLHEYDFELVDALLEYRREHGIFEDGDMVVSINSAFLEYQGVLRIDFINRFNLMLSDGCKGFEVNTICGWSKIIRHATDLEIKAGHRL